MRILTKALVCMALLLAGASPFTALAQTVSAASNPAAAFAKSLQGRLASFDYSYSMSGSLPMNGSGSVRLQGDAFTMEGNGLDIRCDGKTRWTVDVVAEECYIENIEAQELDYEANPALLVGALDSAFNYKDSGIASFNGKSVSEIRLVPKKKGSSIKEVSLFLTQGNQPAGVNISTSDGNLIAITIRNYKLDNSLDLSSFRLNTKELGKDYIITDLR